MIKVAEKIEKAEKVDRNTQNKESSRDANKEALLLEELRLKLGRRFFLIPEQSLGILKTHLK